MVELHDEIMVGLGVELEWGFLNKVTDDNFTELEELLNLKLPEEYVEFMYATNGMCLNNAYFYFNIGKKLECIDIVKIFGFCNMEKSAFNIMSVNKRYLESNSLIPNYVIIASDGMGLVIYNVVSRKVQYWDGVFHALDSERVQIIDLADSFEEFLKGLEPKRKKVRIPFKK